LKNASALGDVFSNPRNSHQARRDEMDLRMRFDLLAAALSFGFVTAIVLGIV